MQGLNDPGVAGDKDHRTTGSSIEKAFFSVLYSMISDNDVPKHISYVMMFLEDVELLSFGLHPHFYKHMPEWAQYVANPLSYRPPRYEDYLIIFGVVVGAITLALASAAKVAFSFESGKFAGASLFALKSLRILTKLLGSVLLMPAVEILLSAIACVGPGRTLIEYPMVQCFEGGYAAETVLAIIFILVYIPFVLLMSAIYVDSKPSTDSVTARVTISRIETIYSTMRIIMSATFTLSEDPRLLLIVAVVLIGSLCYLMVTNQPFYKQELNMFRCGVYTASFFAILVAGVSYLSDSDSKIFPIITIVSIPVGFVVGAIACKVWYRRILRRVYSRLHQKKDAMKDVMVGLDGNIIYKSSKMHDMEKAEYGEGGNDIFDNIKDITSTRTRPKTIKVFRCPAEVEISARYMHNNRTPDALMIMEEIFAEGFRQFPRNSMLYLIFAEYLEAYAPFNEQEPVFYIRKAKSLHPPLDARFFIFMLDRYSEQSKRTEGLNSSTLNISSYVEFQTMQTGARRSHLACLMEQRAFLTHIRSHQRGRDPKTYPIFLQRFSEAERKATDYYKKLITRWPKSKVLLRMYATFLIQVKSDREGAQKYMSVAEDIEEVETQMLTTAARNESRRASLMNFRHASPNASTARSLPLNQNENFVRYSLGQNDKAKTAASSLRGSKTSLRDTIVGSTQMEPTVSIVLEESPSHLMIRPDMHPPPDVDEDLLHSGSTKLPAVSDIIFVENDRSDGSMHRRGPPSLGVVSQKGVGFSRSTRPVDDDDEDDDDEHEKRAEFNAPSESVPSTRSSEREERRKLHCKTQLQSRLKAPVVVLDLRQKIAVTIFIGIAIATIVVGLWSFQQTESSLAVFSRLTRLSRAGTVTAQYIRHLSQAPYIPATQLTLYNTTFVQASTNLDSIMINFTTYYLPYLTAFYNEKEAAGLKVSNHPNPIKSIKYFNTFESTKLLSQYGMELANRDSTWWNSTARVTNKQIRFFLDNAVNIGPMYERAVTDAQGAWSESTMANVYILYALASILFVTFFAWAYCILRPMIEETHDEQVRTLKMFALVPKKALMHMLTDVEEQVGKLWRNPPVK
ncbi:hypothetical protein DFS34DRAFT_418587 [Phlyctochytrium arcticum]|nr:hypothetical protein DFS34DRAFT_418587 [Phlyctochytrium arcticum]